MHPPPTIARCGIVSHFVHEQAKLTAFEIAQSVEALPCAQVVAVHTACQPAVSPLSAGATSQPAPSAAARQLGGTCAHGYALAVADLHGFIATALGGVDLREGHKSVYTLECTCVRATGGLGVVRERAHVLGG